MPRTPLELYALDYPGHKFVGFWRRYERLEDCEEGDRKDALSWPADLVDETQDPLVLETVAQYLDACSFGDHYMGPASCRICGEWLGHSDRTDGKWVWPDQLSHYLRIHKVRLPDDFIEHVFGATKEALWEGK